VAVRTSARAELCSLKKCKRRYATRVWISIHAYHTSTAIQRWLRPETWMLQKTLSACTNEVIELQSAKGTRGFGSVRYSSQYIRIMHREHNQFTSSESFRDMGTLN